MKERSRKQKKGGGTKEKERTVSIKHKANTEGGKERKGKE